MDDRFTTPVVPDMNQHLRNAFLLTLAAVAMLSFGWVGFIASDDKFYAEAALGWLERFPFLGENHWSLRHPFVLPVALSFAVFGVGEHSLAFVVTGFFLATVVIAYWWVAREFGSDQALWVGLVLLTTPMFAVSATIPGPDLTEVFFVLLSLFLLHRGLTSDTAAMFCWAGLAAGMGWLTRETTGALMVFYGLLFLLGFGGSRRRYWLLALGFSLPVLVELSWYWVETGDLLYRLGVDTDRIGGQSADYILPGTGNVDAGRFTRLLNPLLAVFINQEFMLLFFLLIPAALWVWRSAALNASQRGMLKLLLGFTLVWLAVVGYAMPVRGLPRYFGASAFACAMLVALWIGVGLMSRARLLAGAVACALIAANLLGVYVENKQPIFGQRALVAWLAEHPEKTFTDPKTYSSSQFLLREAGTLKLVAPGLPPAGGLYLYNPNRVLQRTRPPGYAEEFGPREGWKEVGRIPAERKLSGYVIEWLGLDEWLPRRIHKRLDRPSRSVVVYRIPAGEQP